MKLEVCYKDPETGNYKRCVCDTIDRESKGSLADSMELGDILCFEFDKKAFVKVVAQFPTKNLSWVMVKGS